MGCEPYWYFINYELDVKAALWKLCQREFKAGRYNPVTPFLEFPVTASSPKPGAQHASIEAALEAAHADGTRSILDLFRIGSEPACFTARALTEEELIRYFGTRQPARQMIEKNMDFFDDMERGHGIYIVVYKGGRPNKLFFAGMSFD